jgi:hypothetical protein
MSLAANLTVSDGGDPSPPAGPSHRQGNPQLIELVVHSQLIGRWVRVGRVADAQLAIRRTRFVGFAPGTVFAFAGWTANGCGAGVLRLDIPQAVYRSAPCSTAPGVTSGAEILLRLSGWPRVQRALETIDAVEALDIDPADGTPDYWRHLGQRLSVGEAARSCTLERHAVRLAHRELAP